MSRKPVLRRSPKRICVSFVTNMVRRKPAYGYNDQPSQLYGEEFSFNGSNLWRLVDVML